MKDLPMPRSVLIMVWGIIQGILLAMTKFHWSADIVMVVFIVLFYYQENVQADTEGKKSITD